MKKFKLLTLVSAAALLSAVNVQASSSFDDEDKGPAGNSNVSQAVHVQNDTVGEEQLISSEPKSGDLLGVYGAAIMKYGVKGAWTNFSSALSEILEAGENKNETVSKSIEKKLELSLDDFRNFYIDLYSERRINGFLKLFNKRAPSIESQKTKTFIKMLDHESLKSTFEEAKKAYFAQYKHGTINSLGYGDEGYFRVVASFSATTTEDELRQRYGR